LNSSKIKLNFNLFYLHTGNESDAKNEDLLLKEGITHIINVTKNIPFYLENSDRIKIEYSRVSVNDSCDQDIKKYFDETNKFIKKVKEQNGKVLVHCQAGISRSSTIVIAYLMNMNNISLMEAYNTVKNIRTIVEPNFLFYSQLYEYESRNVSTDKMEEN
jgi:dual specificity MAP kinase phosphatase